MVVNGNKHVSTLQSTVRWTAAKHLYKVHARPFYTINLSDAVTLGGAYDGQGVSPMGHAILQWVVGLQQQCRLFTRKAEVTA